MEQLRWLQDWYASQCDGDWEHEFGVEIGTLDNPGWSLKVDLQGTALADRHFDSISREETETTWIHLRVRDQKFEGFGGPRDLERLLAEFRRWAEASRSS